MRLSQLLIATLREDPADAEIPSHKLLARGGFIVKIAAGVYTFSPLMWRVVKNMYDKVERGVLLDGSQAEWFELVGGKYVSKD